jgi:hypothetical protein
MSADPAAAMWEVLTRGWENFVARSDGPLSLRFLIQPTVAIVMAVRAGLRDAREGNAPYLWSAITTPDSRAALLRGGWKDVRTIFVIALILDSVYQLVVQRGFYVGELLFTATLLALVPYALVRGAVTRLASLSEWSRRRSSGTSAKDDTIVGPRDSA